MMHEYSIVQALVDRVEEVARRRGATAVERLEVSIGEVAGVEVGLLETAFDVYRPGTLCASAALQVRVVPALWACRACGGSIEKGRALGCAACGGLATLVQGDEIVLERIEMEVA
jgi:hydrogenase nickel incorporation protein HypA/HybF